MPAPGQPRGEFTGHGFRSSASAADLRLLVRLMQGDAPAVAHTLAHRPNGLASLAAMCNRSGLSIVLLRALEAAGGGLALAPDQIDRLHEARRRHEARRQTLGQALTDVADLFESHGQRFILVKGPYLAARFYGDAAGREYVDVDLLVPLADRARAAALLESAGYRRRSGILVSERLTQAFVHGFDYHSGRAGIDLHWALSRHPSLRLDEAALWAQAGTFTVDGRAYRVLGDAHDVLFGALGLLRDIARGRPKPKNIIDLIRMAITLDARLDWPRLLSARDGTAKPLRRVLGLCLALTDAADLAPQLADALRRSRDGLRPLPASVEASLHFSPHVLSLGDRLWAARVYETNPISWAAWWAVSLPFRMAVHRASGRRG